MNRILIPVLFAFAATAVHAQMSMVVQTNDRTFYMDAKAAQGAGELHRVPLLEDYSAAQANGMRSRRMLLEVDCSGLQVRGLSSTDYAEPMAAGRTIESSTVPSDWLYVGTRTGSIIPQPTPYRTIWQTVCR
jgi:hypothetical protein